MWKIDEDYNVLDQIRERTQYEANIVWARTENLPLPPTMKIEKVKITKGLVNFSKDLLLSLRP